MTFGDIQFTGLASGLDTNAIIAQLMAVERLPINLLESQKATEQSKLDLVGTFKGLVQELQNQADSLQSEFLSFNVSAGAEGVAGFETTSEAVAGSHTIEITQLAQADVWAFNGVSDPDVDLASAVGERLSFKVGGENFTFSIDDIAESSLNEIAAEINSLAGEHLTANVVNVGTDAAPSYQLVMSADETGVQGSIVDISSTIRGLVIDPSPTGANHLVSGQDAVAVIDGLTVTRETNDFEGVIPGVSINALATNVGTPMSFTVDPNAEGIKQGLQEFVDAYNAVMGFINTQNSYSEDGGPGGDLFGDSLLSTVKREIQSALFNVDIGVVQADTEGYSTLGLVGIETNSDGTLTIDDSVFDDKLAENLSALEDLFVDRDGFDNGGAAENTPEYFEDLTADDGLADNLDRVIDRMFGTFTTSTGTVLKSLFDARTDSLNSAIDRIDGQIDSKERYLETYEGTLVQRFSRLEELMGALNAQGAALNQALLSLNG